MHIAIAGGHGQIALVLTRLLSDRGHSVRSIIRNPDHADDVRAAGAEPVVLDLEQAGVADVAAALDGVDEVVFAAGAGPGSGVERKYTVDQGASDLCVAAAISAGVPRFLQISSMGADRAPAGDDVFAHYLRAKAAAEASLRDSGLAAVILRPGGLTDGPATGRVELSPHVARGSISRADVAAVILGLIERPGISNTTLELAAGTDSIEEALSALST